MKQLKHNFLFTLLMSMVGLNAFAHDFEVGGIYYKYESASDNVSNVLVTFKGNDIFDMETVYKGDVVIPSKVTYRGKTYNVTGIYEFAFNSCFELNSVSIPNSVTTISQYAFTNAPIESITIPSSVTYIGTRAFRNCTNLRKLIIMSNDISIWDEAFQYCSVLAEVEYHCQKIGKWLYSDNPITKVTIGNEVKEISSYAFSGLGGLTSITIPSCVTSIGDRAFYNCNGLTSVTVGRGSPLSIDSYTFSNQTNATLYVPKGSKEAYETADYWKEFKEIVEMPEPSPTIEFADTNVKAICVAKWDTNKDGELSEAEAEAVTNIGTVFKNKTNITSFNELKYFTGLTNIGYEAFRECSGLTSITIPNNVTSIGNWAFGMCSGLTSITIPNNVTSIGGDAFNCSGLSSIIVESENLKYDSRGNCNAIIETASNTLIVGCKNTVIPNNVTSIGNDAFSFCTDLTSITIPNGVTSIGSDAFEGCTSLTTVAIPSSVTKIGRNAFYRCSALTAVHITDLTAWCGIYFDFLSSYGEVTNYYETNPLCYAGHLFLNGTEIKDLVIPDGVKSISSLCFYGCKGLTSVTIPNSVKYIGRYAFQETNFSSLTFHCESIEEEWFSVSGYHSQSFSGSGIIELVIGNEVTSIYLGMFEKLSNLESVTIGTGITKIGPFYKTHAPLKVIWLSGTPPEGYQDFGGKINYVPNDSYTNLSNLTVYPSLSSLFKVNGVKYVPVNSTTRTCDAIDCIYDGSAETLKIAKSVTYKNTTWKVKNVGPSICYQNPFVKEAHLSFDGEIGEQAFFVCSNLKTVTIDDGVTSIGIKAFESCGSLTSVTIPNSVTNIGDNAFSGCYRLTSITIPNSVTSIGSSAFSGCEELTSLTIGSNVTSIGEKSFSGCMALTSLTIPSSVATIGDNAFLNCGLTAINVEEGNTVYDSRTNCNAIIKTASNTLIIGSSNTIIPNNVTSIGDRAFQLCTGLTSVTIPNSVKNIGEYAFYGCKGLTSVTVEKEIPLSIDSYTFSNRTNATLYVPFGCKAAYKAATYWKDFKEIVEMPSPTIEFADTNVKAICVANWDTNKDGELSEAEAAAVTELGDVFNGKTNIKSFDELKYFTGLTSIGYWAFGDCSGLTSITIPNSVASISREAFYGCSSLISVTIPNSVTSINYGAFSNSHLTSITIPNSVKTIGERAFMGCTSLTSISIPNSVTDIEYLAFSGCSSLKTVIIGNGVTSIVSGVFNDCSGLTSITIPNSVTSIGGVAFSGCSRLTSITIPNSVTKIGDGAFQDCSSLTSINIPNSVTSIGELAFIRCSSLTSTTIPNSVTSIGRLAFCSCSGLISIKVESGNANYDSRNNSNAIIETASNTLIVGCKNTIIPNSITSIGESAFQDCKDLTSITIPYGVTSFGNQAFSGCSGLTGVTIERKTPLTINSSTFPSRTNATLYVPYGSKAVYEAADYWKEFKEIVEMPAPYNSHLTMTGSTICKGGKINLPVSMENEEEITAFQFDVEVPEGITITDVQLGERKSDSHTVDFNKQEDGSYRVMGVSLQKTPFSGNEGELVNLMLSADKDIESGNYNIDIKNIVLTTSSKEKIYLEDVSGMLTVLNFEQGDADGDGSVDVADVVAMIDYILDSSTSDIVFLAADMNADGEIDIFDVMIAINIVLKRDNSAGSRTRASGNMEEEAIVTATADGIRLGVNDAGRFTAFQFDVEVAEGMQLTDARLNGNAGNHELYHINNGLNSYRVVGVSMDNSTLTTSGNDMIELSFSKGGCVQISNIVFVTPQKSKVNFASGNSEVTGIGRIRYEQAEETFDLSGRKVNSDRSRLPKGIYIINNKKVVIK